MLYYLENTVYIMNVAVTVQMRIGFVLGDEWNLEGMI